MKKWGLRLLLTLVAVTGLCAAVSAADGVTSKNIHTNNYEKYGTVVESDLYENNGALERVEYINGSVVIEKYSLEGDFVSAVRTITPPLSIYGGFYSGENYNYLVFGAPNYNDDNSVEVVRLQKYTKTWQLIKECSIYGANTYIPFDAGSARMAEAGGKLYLYTCHEMYLHSDGKHHQANMQFIIDIDSFSSPANPTYPYASHSFNQFIKTDGSYMYTVDHGDAYPRSVVLSKYDAGKTSYSEKRSTVLAIVGSTGDNYTGVSVGGLELSADNAIIAGNTVKQDQSTFGTDKQRNIFTGIAPKNMGTPAVKMLTSYTSADGVTPYTPHLVKISDTRFLVMWEEYTSATGSYVTKLVTVDADGNTVSSAQNKLPLSDCKPVLASDGLLHWFVTNSTEPIVYWLDPLTYNAQKTVEEDWSYNEASAVLTVGGKGFMPNDGLPWAQYNSVIKHIVIKKGVYSVSDGAFKDCGALEDVTLSDTAAIIGESAFEGCGSLKSINIPDKTSVIGAAAFKDCAVLNGITLPNGIQDIESDTFKGCTALESINVPDGVKSIGSSAFYGCTALESMTVPDSVKSIGSSAFRECTSLITVVLPNGLNVINSYTFNNCTALKNAAIPESVTSIGFYGFGGCSALENITLPQGLVGLSSSAFRDCTALKTIVIPKGVKGIQSSTFNGDSSLESVVLPDTLTYIDLSAFQDCKKLTDVNIPDSVQTIGSYAFFRCALKKANIPHGITAINDGAFGSCPLEEVNIPNTVKKVGYAAFFGARDKYITVPEGVESIGELAFYSNGLKALAIPETVTNFNDKALDYFYGTVYCTKGSQAETFAAGKNVTYKYVGDMDGDKNITDADAAEVLKYADGTKSVQASDYDKQALIDCNFDGDRNVLDAIKLLNGKG